MSDNDQKTGTPNESAPAQDQGKPEAAEKKDGHLNPSAPEDANVTPGSAGTK